MGYTTDFSGSFQLDEPLTPDQIAYLNRFSGSRRMKRDARLVAKFKDPLRTKVKLPVGTEGEFFVGTDEMDKDVYTPDDPRYVSREKLKKQNPTWRDSDLDGWLASINGDKNGMDGFAGQRKDASVLDYNSPPSTQPSLWCQWVASEDGTEIEWDGGEKFYDYVEWLQYIVDNMLKRWGRSISGEVAWKGESGDDFGKIVVANNKVTTKKGRVVYR